MYRAKREITGKSCFTGVDRRDDDEVARAAMACKETDVVCITTQSNHKLARLRKTLNKTSRTKQNTGAKIRGKEVH